MGDINDFKGGFGKVETLLNEKLKNVEWGEFELKEIFNVKRGKRLIVENRIKGNRPLVTAGYENTGISDFISNKDQEVFSKNTITIDMFGNSFYRNYEYSADDNILVLFDKEKILSSYVKIFITTQINKSLYKKFDYSKQYRLKSFNNTKIYLPLKNNKIDFEFMEEFIKELENAKLQKVKEYLKENNLDDTILTKKEKEALENFEKVKWGEFRIGDLFEINSSKKRFDANKITILENGYPYVVRQSSNNGIKGYLNEAVEFLNERNTISFGQDTATMFYQKEPYFTGDKIKILKLKNKSLNKILGLFFISTMTKSFSLFSWGSSSFSVKIIQNHQISLPLKNDKIDFEFMENFISALQKLSTKKIIPLIKEKNES